MKYKNQKTESPAGNGSTSTASAVRPAAPPLPGNKPAEQHADVLYRAIDLAAEGRCDKALSLLNRAKGRDDQIVNAIGVCLLRQGRFEEAVPLFRRLVLAPGCTWMRSAPTAYKTNYATALLLSQRPAGCLEILGELHCEKDPTVQRLRAAIKRWESQLTFWQRLNWWLGRIEPSNRTVPLDFPPGDFGVAPRPEQAPGPVRTPAPGKAA
jgi:hypothetical protein